MTIQRMEHVGIVVDDLEAATAFFVELGLKLRGEGQVEGSWVERCQVGKCSGMSPERQPPHPVTDRLFQLYDVLVDVTRKPAPT